eukprot:scaffold1359_cov181-Skeletonema_menzelii.AAC.2
MSSIEYLTPVQATIDPDHLSLSPICLTEQAAIDNQVFITPKQVITDSNHMQPCPPPPRPGRQLFELFVPTQEPLAGAPLGFFLAAPLQLKNNQGIKLLPKRSRNHYDETYRGLSARTA